MGLTEEMPAKAGKVAGFLKGLANRDRMLILCSLATGEKTVSQMIEETGIAPTSMSQHLAKLKAEGILEARRDHRTLFYSITHPAIGELMAVLYNHFCKEDHDA